MKMDFSVRLTDDELLKLMGGDPLNARGPFGLTLQVTAPPGVAVGLSASVIDKNWAPVGHPIFGKILFDGDSITIMELAKLFTFSVTSVS